MYSGPKFLAMAAVLIACSGGARMMYAAPPARDACSLLTTAQASAALGVGVRVRTGWAPPRPQCTWGEAGTAPSGQGKGVTLTILVTLGPDVTSVDRFNSVKVGRKFKTVSGIGDDAVYSTDYKEITRLFVKKGTFVFSVSVSGLPAKQVQEKEKTLALDVLAKL